MDGRKRLAKAFEGHMKRMGWSQQHVAAIGGPSTTTQTKIIHGSGPLSRQTCQKIDLAMGWPQGTAVRVAAGEMEPPEGKVEIAGSLAPISDLGGEMLTATADRDPQGRVRYRGLVRHRGHAVEVTYTPPPGLGLKIVEFNDVMGETVRSLRSRARPVVPDPSATRTPDSRPASLQELKQHHIQAQAQPVAGAADDKPMRGQGDDWEPR